jgi:hypothetical protein
MGTPVWHSDSEGMFLRIGTWMLSLLEGLGTMKGSSSTSAFEHLSCTARFQWPSW